jgi:predicted HTH transcriptional regulator
MRALFIHLLVLLSFLPGQVALPLIAHAEVMAGSQPGSFSVVVQPLPKLSKTDLRILKLLKKQGYLTNDELLEYFDHLDSDLLEDKLVGLRKQKLIRMIGAGSDAAYKLTDWASEALDASLN